MTVRLRLTCEGKTSEYLFDRATISLGRAPFNDISIPSSTVAPRHGALSFEQGAPLRFHIKDATQSTRLVRDGDVVAEVEVGQSATLELAGGDFLILGAHVRLEILSARQQPRDLWTKHTLPEPGALDDALALALLTASARLARAPGDLHVLLREAAALSEVALQLVVHRAVISIFTHSDEFLDDTWGVHFGEAASHHAEIFDVARAPLSRFGAEGALAAREALATHAVVLTAASQRHEGAQMVYLGIMEAEVLRGVLAMECSRPCELERLAPCASALGALSALSVSVRQARLLTLSATEENRYFRERERRHYLFKELVCESPKMRALYQHINERVRDDDPVLIFGEAGSGKELIARALHHLGQRSAGMFISLHCGRLSDEALGVELFGSVASQLAGAHAARKGILELAHDGTVYLEEIDLLSPMLQGKLVRMLKEGEVRRAGDVVGRRVSARLLVSTHRPLRELVHAGKLRHDFYLLLKEHALRVPALRDRAEDLLPLGRLFLKSFARRYEKRVHDFSPQVSQRLAAHDWPGNVRELQSFIEAAVLKCSPHAELLDLEHLNI